MERPRRLRRTAALRRLNAETDLRPHHLIQPIFIAERPQDQGPITSMPGVVRESLESLPKALSAAQQARVGAVMLFAIPAVRDALGSQADAPDGILNRAIRVAKDHIGSDLVVSADLCLDEFTDHGHCGVVHDGHIDNDATLARYQSVAISQAKAGADLLGLSGMMDGQVAAVRSALDQADHQDVALLAYAAKFASAWYGPFREAVDSQLSGDRLSYQQDPGNGREAQRELRLDLAEGADIVMVKPGMGYYDVLANVAEQSDRPVWVYQVSGEYSAIKAAAAQGWLDEDALVRETLLGARRSGADGVVTYWATELAQTL